jgi:long-chain acyl-CoA synthetase
MINISGYKVYSIELDDMLYGYPGVNEAAVIGVPDPERPGQERVKAFVVPKPEYRGKIKEEDVIKFFREKVPPYAVSKSVEIRDEELPKTLMEKIFKRQLREEEIEKMKKAGVLK